jgi:hypothetical protein
MNMDNKKKSGEHGQIEIVWIIIIVAILVSALFGSRNNNDDGDIRVGSPSGSENIEREITRIPSSGQTENNTPPPSSEENIEESNESLFKDKIGISSASAFRNDPNEEYIEIFAKTSNKEKILITGWTLENTRGERFKIGSAPFIPRPGQLVGEQAIFLEPGARAHIITGESPIGTSFQTNLCTGYFSQFDKFEPSLREDCPAPYEEPGAQNFEDVCLDYFERLPRCEQIFENPINIPSRCRSFVNERINYATCVDNHRNENDFFKNEWFIYLKRSNAIWKERRETIILKDLEGKIVDSFSY